MTSTHFPSARFDRTVGRTVFGPDADGYDAGRSSYPPALYEAMAAHCGPIAGRRLFEVGAGTGIATRDLLGRKPLKLTAIEPDPAMAQRLRGQLGPRPDLAVVVAPFEEADLPAHSFDLGCAAASLHWVDPSVALLCFRRLLKRGGRIALWWNSYRRNGPPTDFEQAIAPLMEGVPLPPSDAADTHYSLDIDTRLAELREHGFTAVHHWRAVEERRFEADAIASLYRSLSWLRRLPDDRRGDFLRQLHDLAQKRFANAVPVRVVTSAFFGRSSID